MRVLITGATGFIGSHVVKLLLDMGCQPVLLFRVNSVPNRISHFLERCEIHIIENSLVETLSCIRNVQAVIHLATLYKKESGLDDLESLINGNFTNSVVLYEWAESISVEKYIFFSSYFTAAELDENGICVSSEKAFNVYGGLKYAVESYVGKRNNNVPVCILNVFTPYGPRDNEKLVLSLIRAEIDGRELKLSTPKQGLDMVYIDDVVKIVSELLIDRMMEPGVYKFDVGSGSLVSLDYLKTIISECVFRISSGRKIDCFSNQNVLPENDSPKASSMHDNSSNLTSLEMGIEETVKWVLSNEY